MGFGSMVLSPGLYSPVTELEGEAALDAAVDAALAATGGRGRLLIDTSDSCGGDDRGEQLIGHWSAGRRSAGRRDEVMVSTKFGFRPPAGEGRHAFEVSYAFGKLAVNGSPKLVRGYAIGSLERLGVECLDLLSPHCPDPVVPISETVGAIAELVEEGLVANVGVSNVSAGQLAEAASVCRIAAVQVEWSMWHRVDPGLLEVADRHGIGIVAWGRLGSGFLAGVMPELDPGDYRHHVPRLAGPNLTVNTVRYGPVRALAQEWGVTPAQLALAWLLRQLPAVVPIPGSRLPDHIAENAAAAGLMLYTAQWARLDEALEQFDPVGPSLLPVGVLGRDGRGP
jgi:aryl-alcohol dehydrogenase-like predicted oxidoreductase